MLVCDLQGYMDDKKGSVLLTDPAIHSKELLRGGKTNLSMPGIRRFAVAHECGPTCHRLGLPPFFDGL